MGQARLRGTLQERTNQAVEKAAADKRAAERMKAANERQRLATIAAMPPEARRRYLDRERVKNLRMQTWLALGAGLLSMR
jgi:hypothetical protein